MERVESLFWTMSATRLSATRALAAASAAVEAKRCFDGERLREQVEDNRTSPQGCAGRAIKLRPNGSGLIS
jgi:hypothetical protein